MSCVCSYTSYDLILATGFRWNFPFSLGQDYVMKFSSYCHNNVFSAVTLKHKHITDILETHVINSSQISKFASKFKYKYTTFMPNLFSSVSSDRSDPLPTDKIGTDFLGVAYQD